MHSNDICPFKFQVGLMLKKKCQSQGWFQSALPKEKPKVADIEEGGTFLSSKRRLKGNALKEFQIWSKIQ